MDILHATHKHINIDPQSLGINFNKSRKSDKSGSLIPQEFSFSVPKPRGPPKSPSRGDIGESRRFIRRKRSQGESGADR